MSTLALSRLTVSNNVEFQNRIDDADPYICARHELQQLIDDAPDEYAMGYLAGIFNMRQMQSILTGRTF